MSTRMILGFICELECGFGQKFGSLHPGTKLGIVKFPFSLIHDARFSHSTRLGQLKIPSFLFFY